MAVGLECCQLNNQVYVPQALDAIPLELVSTPEQLQAMAGALQGAPEVAVDLEAHAFRSFQGFTCLMQLSTRTVDYIVDTLALRSHIGRVFWLVFAGSCSRYQCVDQP